MSKVLVHPSGKWRVIIDGPGDDVHFWQRSVDISSILPDSNGRGWQDVPLRSVPPAIWRDLTAAAKGPMQRVTYKIRGFAGAPGVPEMIEVVGSLSQKARDAGRLSPIWETLRCEDGIWMVDVR